MTKADTNKEMPFLVPTFVPQPLLYIHLSPLLFLQCPLVLFGS